MKHILVLLIAILVLSYSSNTEQPLLDEQPAQNQEQPSQEDIQRFYSMRRTACIVLSRHFINSRKDEVEGVFSELEPEKQSQYANKLYTAGVEVCEQHIVPNQVQELFVQNDNFDPSVYFPIFMTFDIVGISKNSLKLNKGQEHILQSIKQFDDDMAIRKEEQQSEQSKLNDEDKYDIKMFNISAKNMSPLAKTIYGVVFLSIVGGLLFWGFKQLDKHEPKKKDKKKKQVSPPKRA